MALPEGRCRKAASAQNHAPHIWTAPGQNIAECPGYPDSGVPRAVPKLSGLSLATQASEQLRHALDALADEEMDRRRANPADAYDQIVDVLNRAPDELLQLLLRSFQITPVNVLTGVVEEFKAWLRKQASSL